MVRRPGRIPVLLLAVLVVSGLAGCGGDDSAVDHSNYESVYDGAMRAVAARDLEALWPLLTENGRDGVERSLREWQGLLRDEAKGAYILQKIRENGYDPDPEQVDLARHGRLHDAFDFFLRADPRPARPPRRGLQVAPDGSHVVILYEDPQGTHRPVRLVPTRGGWFVEDLQL